MCFAVPTKQRSPKWFKTFLRYFQSLVMTRLLKITACFFLFMFSLNSLVKMLRASLEFFLLLESFHGHSSHLGNSIFLYFCHIFSATLQLIFPGFKPCILLQHQVKAENHKQVCSFHKSMFAKFPFQHLIKTLTEALLAQLHHPLQSTAPPILVFSKSVPSNSS